MAKKQRLTKTELIARLHRGLRPKLTRDQRLDLGLCHVANLDVIARGEAQESMLWDWVGSVLTWSKVAEMLDLGVDEMVQQLALAERLVSRYGRTGRVAFDGPDYQLAKIGLEVMDQLAHQVDRPTAIAAADWSERRVNEMAAECARLATPRPLNIIATTGQADAIPADSTRRFWPVHLEKSGVPA